MKTIRKHLTNAMASMGFIPEGTNATSANTKQDGGVMPEFVLNRSTQNTRPIHYIHRRDGLMGHNGATISFRENDAGTVDVALTICDPRDNFSRKSGRIRSGGRLDSSRRCHVVDVPFEEFRDLVYGTPAFEYHLQAYPTVAELELAKYLGRNPTVAEIKRYLYPHTAKK